MLLIDFEIVITKTFTAALMLSPFGFYGDILKLVYTMSSCGVIVSATCRKSAVNVFKNRSQSLIYKLTCV